MFFIIKILFQNWGDYTGMSQAVIIYVTYASDVLLICWCGTQLTQHVRKDVSLFLMLLALIGHYIYYVYWASNQLRNNGANSALSVFLPYSAFCIEFFGKFWNGVLKYLNIFHPCGVAAQRWPWPANYWGS